VGSWVVTALPQDIGSRGVVSFGRAKGAWASCLTPRAPGRASRVFGIGPGGALDTFFNIGVRQWST
jgi:hypothetical protein